MSTPADVLLSLTFRRVSAWGCGELLNGKFAAALDRDCKIRVPVSSLSTLSAPKFRNGGLGKVVGAAV